MAGKVHALMQHANDLDAQRYSTEEQHVRSDKILAVSGSYLVTSSPPSRVFRNSLNGGGELAHVDFCLSRPQPAVVYVQI